MLRAPAEGCLFFYVRPAGSVYWQGDSFCNTRACLKKAFCKLGLADCGNDFSDTLEGVKYYFGVAETVVVVLV